MRLLFVFALLVAAMQHGGGGAQPSTPSSCQCSTSCLPFCRPAPTVRWKMVFSQGPTAVAIKQIMTRICHSYSSDTNLMLALISFLLYGSLRHCDSYFVKPHIGFHNWWHGTNASPLLVPFLFGNRFSSKFGAPTVWLCIHKCHIACGFPWWCWRRRWSKSAFLFPHCIFVYCASFFFYKIPSSHPSCIGQWLNIFRSVMDEYVFLIGGASIKYVRR